MKVNKTSLTKSIKELEGKKRFIQNNIDFNSSWLCQTMQLEELKKINKELERLKKYL